MKKALILTVGTGTRADVNIVKPLVKTIKDSAPGLIGFVVSDGSRPYAEEIIRHVGLSLDQFEIVGVSDPDNLDNIYSEVNGCIRSILQRGYSPEEITIDFTSGTKAMTSGAVLAGVAWGCAGLKYITGKRKEGVVQNGTEKFITVQPNTILAHREMEIGRRLIEAFRFESAVAIFSSINRALLSAREEKHLDGLMNVANGYDSWDKFIHNRTVGYLSKIPPDLKELDHFRIPHPIGQRLIAINKALEKEEITNDILADLFNNAHRRSMEGKYDDAMARIYRLVEMLAQMTLWQGHGISTGDVPENRISASMQEVIKLNRDPTDGRIKIGLQKSYDLLHALGDPLGKSFFQSKRLSALLKLRNESFLAHGTKPITGEACQSLFKEVRALLLLAIPSFYRLCEELSFPWQRHQE